MAYVSHEPETTLGMSLFLGKIYMFSHHNKQLSAETAEIHPHTNPRSHSWFPPFSVTSQSRAQASHLLRVHSVTRVRPPLVPPLARTAVTCLCVEPFILATSGEALSVPVGVPEHKRPSPGTSLALRDESTHRSFTTAVASDRASCSTDFAVLPCETSSAMSAQINMIQLYADLRSKVGLPMPVALTGYNLRACPHPFSPGQYSNTRSR